MFFCYLACLGILLNKHLLHNIRVVSVQLRRWRIMTLWGESWRRRRCPDENFSTCRSEAATVSRSFVT